VDRIIDNNTGRIYTDSELLDNRTEHEIFLLRRELQIDLSKDTPKYACAYCKSRLYLRGTERKIIHFYHTKRNPDCPLEAYPQWSLDELRAYIYRGAKEGPLHKTIKNRLSCALKKDSRFTEIKIEKAISDGKSWRKPDIQARFNGEMRVFEIQISNTFLSVIVARELFYRDRDIPLIWIFGEFNKKDTQFFQKDIFYHHNGNLFVFDEETYNKSVANNRLLLKVFYLIPRYENGYVFPVWCDNPEIVDFSEIKYDKDKDGCYRAFLKNYDLHTAFAEDKAKLFDFIFSKEGQNISNNEIQPYFNDFGKYNFPVYEKHYDLSRLRLLLLSMLSINTDAVYGYKYDNYKSLIQQIYHDYYNVFWLLYEYIKTFGYLDKILSNDKKGTMSNIINSYRGDNNYHKERKYNKLFRYLFEGFQPK
jgi:hypothetical protein